MLDELRQLHNDLKTLRRDIQKETAARIAKNDLRRRAEACATFWFNTVSPALSQHTVITTEAVERYSGWFATLLKLSRPNNHRVRYLAVLQDVLKRIHDDLIVPIQTEPKLRSEVSLLAKMLGNLPNEAENIYLSEAINCATHGFLRAAAVLGWTAAIDRIHLTVERIGFAKFNTIS
jgi:isocitrate dehydrogenase kinase/phosphatase